MCASCSLISICAICCDCKKIFCEICCNTHNRSKPLHKVYMIEHVTTSTYEVNCEYCNNLATAACLYCAVVFCDYCQRGHSGNNHNVKMLIKYNGVPYQRGNTEGTSKLECKYTISTEENVEPLSIRGIAFLKGDRILLVDYNRSEIKVFKENSFTFNYPLGQEPNCMTKLNDNRVAISFPHEKTIKLYDIFNRSVNLSKTINLQSIGKPFSISYHEKYFAVEIGEGKNGGIFIINGHGNVNWSVPNVRSFAFFTGNTIRLALDMKNRCIFVSALGSKSVHCIDFDGHNVWCKAIPSPRGIVFIPEASSDMNMIVASKQWNIIYKMNSHNGTDKIITAAGLTKGPRHMDYNIKEKLLCVEIDNGNILVFKYDINMLDEPE